MSSGVVWINGECAEYAGSVPSRVSALPASGFFFSAKQAAVHMTESGSPSRWARPALSAAGGGSGQRAQRALFGVPICRFGLQDASGFLRVL